ncbi:MULTISPECIES: universal stress protein [Kocuria]|uniref:Universal stress protein n=1 Tax=Kocuria oceani TaxID=988827 RepID=A0ABV9TKM0_9MICC|nr:MULTISPECIES: universal stress protein [Kocuria]KLU08181.1 universal stress protein UspA [Kocuria sp. SM24M-10]OLT09177.1 universal stress protein UspA [Kocuria sp. CNJ-770]
MTVVVGYMPTAPGHAALDAAIREAERRGTDLVVVQPRPKRHQTPEVGADIDVEREKLTRSGLRYELREPEHDSDPADVILDTAREREAELIVLGIRRRSPVGKIIMASTAQRVLLESPCPVLSVKAVYD